VTHRLRGDECTTNRTRGAAALHRFYVKELKRKSARWDNLRFESAFRACKNDVDVRKLTEGIGHGEAWKNVASRAATRDENAPPAFRRH
jgi:hypothetical protein